MKTFIPKILNGADRKWYIVDATDITLGKLSTQVACVLRGKNKPTFTPHLDLGDYVIITNAEKIKLTGNKLEDKKYYRHSGYIGNLKVKTAKDIMETNPEKIIELSVKGMIPRNKLKKDIVLRLKIFKGSEHEHGAQSPEVITINQ